jgi:hypothetical protein
MDPDMRELIPAMVKNKDPGDWQASIAQNGMAFECVPKKVRTKELCLAALAQPFADDQVLAIGGGIPAAYWDDAEFASSAFIADIRIAFFVREELRTAAAYRTAIQHGGNRLKDVPEELRTPEICLAAVTKIGCELKVVPEKLKTAELCLAAVKQNSNALRYVPKELKGRAAQAR